MKEAEKFSIKKRLKSFQFAFNGIKHLLIYEHNARIHLLGLIAIIILGICFKIALIDWMILTIVTSLVIITELFNTAIENIADFIEPSWNEKIKLIKDYCAAAVLISVVISIIVGGFIFIPKIMKIITI